MKAAILPILFLFASVSQAQSPVTWSFAVNDDKLEMTATIEDGWHIYGLELESDEGPLPTVLEFNSADVSWGDLLVPEPKAKYDEMFMMNITYYDKEVTFARSFVTQAAESLRGSVDYMVCNDETCLPPKLLPFEVSLKPEDN